MTDATPFEARSTLDQDVLTVGVVGEVDMSTAPRLLEILDAVSEASRLVVVDLTEVSFLDSSGLNVLVKAQRRLAPRGIALRVVVPSDHALRRVFEIARLEEQLQIVESAEEART
jgi:anti-sigma B factor antagonist